ncbi:MAG TPA: magnesium-translocating P-type ATPase [Candidatus Dormibacteraeota bacterium]|nr:magnesium-translocating P-type ATPase [Candidatus Dormibacteraeota bacterium]
MELVEAARLTAAEALERLESTPAGLTAAEHDRRLGVYGPNAIRSHGTTPLTVLWRQLRNPLLLLLGVATAVSFAVGERTDALIILAIVGLSVGLGFFNEYRSERVVEALHNSIRHHALALRGGAPLAVDVTDLVPGDVVLLRTGDLVPADVRLLEARELEADEAVLTGEAMPRTKSADPEPGPELVALGLRSIGYMGTTIRGGSGRGVVVQTGSRTEFGKIALRLGERQPVTAFQRGLGAFSNLLVRVTAVLAGTIFVLNLLLGRSLLESALFALAIAVGLTPQLLPAIVTVSLASGARTLARKRVVVKRLISIEDLGNIEILFTDKTGTLTEGRITFREAIDPDGRPSETVRDLALLASSVTGADSAASGNALDEALAETGGPPDGWERVDILPFDHERRLVSALVRKPDGQTILVTKGAPESVLARSVTAASGSSALLERLFSEGARVVAVGTRPWTGGGQCTLADERDLELAGFVTFLDAPKADAADALRQLQALGVEVKIVTGDNAQVAATVCRTLGLDPGGVLTGPEIEGLSDDELMARIPGVGVFARVSPEQKSRIIGAQRRTGKDVGFLGDGVNDAVALREADVGISVDSGSDVAKDAADIVMLGKDLNILAGGVLEGRRIFSNTMKYVLMGTSSNFGNMFSAAGGSVLLDFLPMTPTQILLNNLLYDAGEMTIPTDEVDPELLERPAQWDIRLIRRFMMFFGPISSIFDFATFAVMLFVFHARGSLFQTAWFTESLCTQSLVIFAIRTRRVPFFRSRPSVALAAGTLGSVLVGLALPFTPVAPFFGFTPLPLGFLLILGVMVVVYLALVEAGKALFFGRSRSQPSVPIELWEHTPGRRLIERIASRWTVAGWRPRRPFGPVAQAERQG